MAQVVVNSAVMREKATRIATDATQIKTLYDDMLREVQTMAGKMSGTTIETARDKFASMQQAFETISLDIKAYSDFLNSAADAYDQVDNIVMQKAEEQGKIF